MSIHFHRLIHAIDNDRLIIIDYIGHIDCLPKIDFHRLGKLGLIKRFSHYFVKDVAQEETEGITQNLTLGARLSRFD